MTTNKILIEKLKALPDNLEVLIESSNGEYSPKIINEISVEDNKIIIRRRNRFNNLGDYAEDNEEIK